MSGRIVRSDLRGKKLNIRLTWVRVALACSVLLNCANAAGSGGSATFRQLYFPAASKDLAERARALLAVDPDSPEAPNLADHTAFASRYENVGRQQISDLFGKHFAKELEHARRGCWTGPIRSEFGWHLVWVEVQPVPAVRAARRI